MSNQITTVCPCYIPRDRRWKILEETYAGTFVVGDTQALSSSTENIGVTKMFLYNFISSIISASSSFAWFCTVCSRCQT